MNQTNNLRGYADAGQAPVIKLEGKGDKENVIFDIS
jgi:hypothetical protein